jgi:hypothetical protein
MRFLFVYSAIVGCDMTEERIELGGVHILRILESDGTMSLEVNCDDEVHPWEIIGMLQVALQWELDSYTLPEEEDD